MTQPKKQSIEQIVNKQQPFNIFFVPEQNPFYTPFKECDVLNKDNQAKPKKSNCLMSDLCTSFIETYKLHPDQPIGISAKKLSSQFGVQLRRIYDLMNILEGLGSVQKLPVKGEYVWKGLNVEVGEMVQPRQLESNSLKQIAARIKVMLIQASSLMTFSEIDSKIYKEYQELYERQINQISLRRRVYECCKILRILGLVQRFQKHYLWAEKNLQKMLSQQQKQQRKKRYLVPRSRKIAIAQSELISEITMRYKTPEALEQFIQRIYDSLKQQNPTTVKKQDEQLPQEPEIQ